MAQISLSPWGTVLSTFQAEIKLKVPWRFILQHGRSSSKLNQKASAPSMTDGLEPIISINTKPNLCRMHMENWLRNPTTRTCQTNYAFIFHLFRSELDLDLLIEIYNLTIVLCFLPLSECVWEVLVLLINKTLSTRNFTKLFFQWWILSLSLRLEDCQRYQQRCRLRLLRRRLRQPPQPPPLQWRQITQHLT